MKNCPRCGSDSGYVFTMDTRHSRIGSFGHMEEETTSETLIRESKTARCVWCNARIPLADIRAEEGRTV